MSSRLSKKYTRTLLYIIDRRLWAWAKYRAQELGYRSVSEYVFKLIEIDKEQDLIGKFSRKE